MLVYQPRAWKELDGIYDRDNLRDYLNRSSNYRLVGRVKGTNKGEVPRD